MPIVVDGVSTRVMPLQFFCPQSCRIYFRNRNRPPAVIWVFIECINTVLRKTKDLVLAYNPGSQNVLFIVSFLVKPAGSLRVLLLIFFKEPKLAGLFNSKNSPTLQITSSPNKVVFLKISNKI